MGNKNKTVARIFFFGNIVKVVILGTLSRKYIGMLPFSEHKRL